jgi:glycosyltransferase involved in cell wall biosynthesis
MPNYIKFTQWCQVPGVQTLDTSIYLLENSMVSARMNFIMRVLLINNFPLLGSGSGIYTRDLGEGLAQAGHEISYLLPDGGPEGVPEDLSGPLTGVTFSGPFPCFTTHPLSMKRFVDMTPEEQTDYVEVWRREIERAIEAFLPDIVHAQHMWAPAYIAASLTDKPVVVSVHGTDLMGIQAPENAFFMPGIEAFSRKAPCVICISTDTRKRVCELLPDLPDASVHLVPNAVDLDSFFPPRKGESWLHRYGAIDNPQLQALGPDDPMVLLVGKLTDFKGIDILIEAIRLMDNRPAVFVAGEGELRAPLLEQVQKAGLQGFTFLGHQSRTQVSGLMQRADMLVVPSRVEPFGLVALEAMASGTPVIASDAGGLVDFVDEKVGARVPMENPQALANAIATCLLENWKARKEADLQTRAQEYSRTNWVKKIAALYERALQEKS